MDCSSADRLYGSRREWLEHEESQHRRIWVCRFHPSVPFPNQHDFEQHLLQQGHGDITDAQLKDFVSIARSIAEDTREKCLVCWEETESIPHFPAHLAHHLERMATFSMPRELDDEDTTSLTSLRAIPRGTSERTSLNSDVSGSQTPGKFRNDETVAFGRASLDDDIVQWFTDISDCDLGPVQDSTSSLDVAMVYAFLESPECASWLDTRSPRRLIFRAGVHVQKVSQQLSC
jgi:hypothetical protein